MTTQSPPMLRGFRGPDACAHSGITYRQLDYWARTGLVVPSVRSAGGSGTQRLYSRDDVVDLALVKVLLDAGCSLQLVRTILPDVRRDRAEDPDTVEVTMEPYTFRGMGGIVTLSIDVATLAARIPDPPQEHEPTQPAQPTGLHLVP